MKNSTKEKQDCLKIDRLQGFIKHEFKQFIDKRDDNISIELDDCLMSGYAMFSLKDSSVLEFNNERTVRASNLKEVYKINKAPSDSGMREILDPLSPKVFNPIFEGLYKRLKKAGIIKSYEYIDGYVLCSIDGVHHFSSEHIRCKKCIEFNKTNGKKEYRHSTLSSVIMHPDKSVVFPIAHEEILRQDGTKKNDCEHNAAKRLLPRLEEILSGQKTVIIEDALSSNGPHIKQLKACGFKFIINVKPKGNKTLFKQFECAKARKEVKFLEIQAADGLIHRFYYKNNMPLNDTHGDIRINFLDYYQIDPTGKKPNRHFSWITDFKLHARNVYKIMRAARSRWKIENETFNTLKNQGYNFTHSYGHGKQFLATVFMLLMMLAFFVDQIQQGYNGLFQQAWKEAQSKKALWKKIRQKFDDFQVDSMEMIYKLIIGLITVEVVYYEDSG
ncbi:MAG: transposase [Candidatus Marinimicrobia bacterium]|jgi:hypothetical protein|nr:transposase [Candidatus Neomarinimicrobiota bacterium]